MPSFVLKNMKNVFILKLKKRLNLSDYSRSLSNSGISRKVHLSLILVILLGWVVQLTCRQQYRKEGSQLFSVSYISKDTILLEPPFLRLFLAPYLPVCFIYKMSVWGFLAFSIFFETRFIFAFCSKKHLCLKVTFIKKKERKGINKFLRCFYNPENKMKDLI